jgi:hypothetical protein
MEAMMKKMRSKSGKWFLTFLAVVFCFVLRTAANAEANVFKIVYCLRAANGDVASGDIASGDIVSGDIASGDIPDDEPDGGGDPYGDDPEDNGPDGGVGGGDSDIPPDEPSDLDILNEASGCDSGIGLPILLCCWPAIRAGRRKGNPDCRNAAVLH